jgi:hypothetical protein
MKVSPCPSHPIIPSQTLPHSQTSFPFLLRASPLHLSLSKPSIPSPLYESLPCPSHPIIPSQTLPPYPSFSVLHPSSSLPKPSTPSSLYESLPLSLSPYYLVANTPSFSNLLTLPSPCFTPLLLFLNPQHPPLSMKVSPCPSHPIIPSQTNPNSRTSLPFLLCPSPLFLSP